MTITIDKVSLTLIPQGMPKKLYDRVGQMTLLFRVQISCFLGNQHRRRHCMQMEK